MKALLVPLFGLVGATFMLSAASADVVRWSPAAQELKGRATQSRAKLRTSASADPDTVWIGHVSTGGYGPHHIYRGPNLIVGGASGPASSYDGVWSFDHFQPGETDSLQGWWSIRPSHSSVGPSDLDDWRRTWFCLDGGNLANYVPPQGSPKRTFGVTGVWHADNGTLLTSTVPGSNPVAPGWSPITGTRSAWCGIRSHGDLTAVDVTGTGNPINDNLSQYSGNNSGRQFSSLRAQGTDHNFPGYMSQWDQMLYRDVTLPANLTSTQTLNVSFKYTTNMSLGFSGSHSSQCGYFYFDPIKTVTSGTDGNFISAAASGAGPVDSFMVFIGAPVNDAAVQLSDGTITTVYDPQRRWFSEVVKINAVRSIVGVAGVNGTTAAPISFSQALGSTVVNPILDADGGAGNGGRVRIVFRIKTNKGFDDENQGNSLFSSGGAGAAIVDDVLISGPSGTLLNDGFEGTNGGVDNGTGTPATSAWKSTGKPPQPLFHVHNVNAGLPFDDPCGALTAAVRLCNMGGNVLVPGDHDNAEKPAGIFGGNFQDALKWAVSPTINLMSSGVGAYNGMGIDAEIASRPSLMFFGDVLLNLYGYDDPPTGNGWRFGWQSYPATQANGVKCWGEMRKSGFFTSTTAPGCFGGSFPNGFWSDAYTEAADIGGAISTTNPSGIPDSVRVYFESMSRCYTLPVTASTCSPTDGPNAGGYVDNISIALARGAPAPQLGIDFARNFNDCFPVNSQNKPVTTFGLAYDTLAARIQTGYNEAPNTSNDITGPAARENIPGDSVLVAALGENVRLDMVFRILPGVGNYVQIGNRASGVARRPDTAPRVAASTSDPGSGTLTAVDKFWGAYLANNGTFGTPGGHGGSWNPNVWNSARCDTAQVNFFPITGLFNSDAIDQLTPGTYMSTYHESDPKYTVVGIVKNRCFLNKNKQPVKLDQSQINCGPAYDPAFTSYPPTFYTAASGLSPSENGLPAGRTYEFTKILPDGQFTPGTLIQYFFRKSEIGSTAFEMAPDTNFILPNNQNSFGYLDGARWVHTAVLPDRWKDPAFGAGGLGMACMLVLDYADRRGDEFIWVSVADSMGLTQASRRGAHNGWRARPDQDVTVNVGSDDSICRRDNGGQPGTLWDLYQTQAGESNIQAGRPGSRGASKDVTAGSLSPGRWATHGPHEDMAKNYKTMVALLADVGVSVIGPFANQTDNDIGMFTSYLTGVGGAGPVRALMFMGTDAGEAFARPDNPTNHIPFMTGHLRASYAHESYRELSGNTNNVSTLSAVPPVTPSGGYTYGHGNTCVNNLDVFNVETAAPAGQGVTFYANVGAAGPYEAAVFANDVSGTRPYRTLINGWTLGLLGQGFGTQGTLLNVGIRKYFFDLFTNAFGGLNCQPTGTPVGVGDGPGSIGSTFVNFMNLKSSNPMRSGEARIAFGVAKTEKVEVRIYDVSGRAVKTVANRVFAGGQEHFVIWDGTSDAGERVKSGVYFYQLKTATWVSQKKLAVLSN